jgi:hypothetical protein
VMTAGNPQTTPITLEWIRSLSTLAAVVLALIIALFGETLKRLFYKPHLQLEAMVRRPHAERVGRQIPYWHEGRPMPLPAGEAWFFRLEISNRSKTPARDVQVYLKKIEKADGVAVTKFTPMHLKWTNTDPPVTTRKVLLRDLPIFCDFIHVSDPRHRSDVGENLNDVPPAKAIMCLDVEATNSAKGHLLGPGAYHFYLYVAAENSPARHFKVEVRYDGTWHLEQDQMFDQEIGFRMRRL